jgi:hypothetical protein
MMGAWFEKRPAMLDEIRAAIATDQPDLSLAVIDGVVTARGSDAVHDGEVVLDRYQVEITLPRDYPKTSPVVEEIGGRIPRTADRHVSGDGTACLLVPEEWLLSPDQSFRAFLTGPMRNFFLGQLLVDAGKQWPFGQRSHGHEGLIEAYMELLSINDPTRVAAYIECLRRKALKGHFECPCGSKKRLRNCHRTELQELAKRIPPHIAQQAHDRLVQSRSLSDHRTRKSGSAMNRSAARVRNPGPAGRMGPPMRSVSESATGW